MSEFKNPDYDGPRAIIFSGVVAVGVYILVPFVMQGVLGTANLLDPAFESGEGVGVTLASMVTNNGFATKMIVVMLTFTLFLACMTAMAGSSRTIYQGGRDGLLPKYLDYLNVHKVPTKAMWTELAANTCLLLMSDYLFLLALSCVNYMFFHFLNLNAGWIHRIDNPRAHIAFRTPKPLFVAGFILSYFNMFLIGAGANIWGSYVLPLGFAATFAVVPIFLYRHYVVDKGKFPERMLHDLIPEGETELPPKRAGILPYLSLAAGAACMAAGYIVFYVIY